MNNFNYARLFFLFSLFSAGIFPSNLQCVQPEKKIASQGTAASNSAKVMPVTDNKTSAPDQASIAKEMTPASGSGVEPAVDAEGVQLSTEQLEQLKATISQVLDTLVSQIVGQTKKIEALLEELSLSINNNAIGNGNKKALLQQIKRIRTMISGIKSEAFVEVTPQTIQFLVLFNEALMKHLSAAIAKGFKRLPPLDKRLAKLRQRTISMDIQEIENKLQENKKRLIALDKKAQQIGLKWHNKVFRKINNFIVKARRRKWDQALLGVTVLGVIAIMYTAFYTKWGYTEKDKDLEDICKFWVQGDKKQYGRTRICDENAFELAKQVYQKTTLKKNGKLITVKTFLDNIRRDPRYHRKTERDFFDDSIALYKEVTRRLGINPEPRKGFAQRFRGLVGHTPFYITGEEEPINAFQVRWLGKLDHNIRKLPDALNWLLFPVMAAIYKKDWVSNATGWLRKRVALLYSSLMGGDTGKRMKHDQKKKDEGLEPKYTFDDVVGLDHIKGILNNILEYIKDPERFDRANIPPERGYLFTGLPGTGKSFLAEAFGGEIRKVFKAMGRSEDELGFYSFDAAFINEEGIKKLLRLAKKEAPCVIFIDEIDLLRLQRGNGNSELLSEFLGAMSGVLSKESANQVIVLAATNRPEHLDKALRRRGRFGKIIHFELPTLAERKAFIVNKLEPLLPDLSVIDIDKLAQETEGRTYEELSAMLNSAFQYAKIHGEPLTQQHLENSLNKEINNIINSDLNISVQEQKLVAYHQAGHALAHELLQSRRELAGVTIKPIAVKLENESVYAQYYGKRKQQDVVYGKVFTKCAFDHLGIFSREEKINDCKIILAGMVAERILLGSCGHSYHANDKQEALDIVKSLVFEGLHAKTMPKKIRLEYFQKALALLQQYESEIETLLKEHQTALERIANDLQKFETLDARKIKEIIADSKGSSLSATAPLHQLA